MLNVDGEHDMTAKHQHVGVVIVSVLAWMVLLCLVQPHGAASIAVHFLSFLI